MIDFIERHWPLHHVEIKADLGGFDERLVYRLEADEGQFVVKAGKAFYTESEMERALFVFDFLRAHSFASAPRLLKCRDGAAFRRLPEGLTYIYHFIEGLPPVPSTDTYRKLGQTLAALHELEGYPHRGKWSAGDVKEQIIRERAPRLPSEMRNEYLQIAERISALDKLPLRLVHGDISLSNSIQTANGEIVLLDWDGCALQPRILDVGFSLLQFLSSEGLFASHRAEAFYRAYFAAQKLAAEELACLADAALLRALNFIFFGDVRENWARIKWINGHRDILLRSIDELRS